MARVVVEQLESDDVDVADAVDVEDVENVEDVEDVRDDDVGRDGTFACAEQEVERLCVKVLDRWKWR